MATREVRRPIFRTGESCTQPGVYASSDCGHEIAVLEGEPFQECPIHTKPVDWTFVKAKAAS